MSTTAEPDASDALSQATYQVRLEWDAAGLTRLADTDVVVVVDVLRLGSSADEDASLRAAIAAHTAVAVAGGLRDAAAVAGWVASEQAARGRRTSVAVIARSAPVAGGTRFAVENLLGAGAVIAALGDCGIDHCSPEAALAGEGFRALRGAVRHLLTASASGLALAAAGRRDDILEAASVDASTEIAAWADGGTDR